MRRACLAATLVVPALALSLATACEDLGGLRGGDVEDAGASNDAAAGDVASNEDSSSPADAADGSSGCDLGPVSNDLLVFFPFEEGAGTTTKDCGPLQMTGLVSGNKSWVAGKHGGGLQFDGLTACVTVASNPALGFTGTFTLSAWVNVTAFPLTSNSSFVIGRTITTNDDGFRLAAENGASLSLKLGLPGDASYFQLSSPAQMTGKWIHVASVFVPGTSGAFYIDGVSVDVDISDIPPGITPSSTDLRIGCGTGNNYFQGAIDDVRIYTRALSAGEIAMLAQ